MVIISISNSCHWGYKLQYLTKDGCTTTGTFFKKTSTITVFDEFRGIDGIE